MAEENYDTHASTYDTFDESVERRTLTHAAIDAIVASELGTFEIEPKELMFVVCETR